MDFEKKPGKYIHGGCGTIIDLPLGTRHLMPSRTECGLGFVYCETCQTRMISDETKKQD